MRLKAAMIAVAVVGAPGCGTSPTVLAPEADSYPPADEGLLDRANCPDGDPDGDGVLHDPVDGTAGAISEARRQNGRMYVRCRSAFHGLVEHERKRVQRIRERAMQDQ